MYINIKCEFLSLIQCVSIFLNIYIIYYMQKTRNFTKFVYNIYKDNHNELCIFKNWIRKMFKFNKN
jgi:hypothetical protein